MVRIIKGRYGYAADDGTVQIAENGKVLLLDKKEEERLIKLGCAEPVEEKEKEKKKEEETVPLETPKPRRRKGRKS